MWDMNSGYDGYSMSKNAVLAYESGEKPKSRWTKGAMIDEIRDYLIDMDIEHEQEHIQVLNCMTKKMLFEKFFEWKSWHHTSKFANETDFYGLDEESLVRFFETELTVYYTVTFDGPAGIHESSRIFYMYDNVAKTLTDLGYTQIDRLKFEKNNDTATIKPHAHAIMRS